MINSAQFFKLYMKITKPDTTFTKGDYTDMQTNLDYEAIVTYLQTQSNRTDVVTVTFLEGMNLEAVSYTHLRVPAAVPADVAPEPGISGGYGGISFPLQKAAG